MSPAPQTPGKIVIDTTPGQERVEIDGYRLEQHVVAFQLRFDAKSRRPVIRLELAPSTVTVNGTGVVMEGELRELLLAQGWQPPR